MSSAVDPQKALAECRQRIDRIDRRLIELLNERTSIAREIGCIKQEAQLPVYEPKRETEVFENVNASNHGPLTADAVRRIFERIIDEMRRVQKDGITDGEDE